MSLQEVIAGHREPTGADTDVPIVVSRAVIGSKENLINSRHFMETNSRLRLYDDS